MGQAFRMRPAFEPCFSCVLGTVNLKKKKEKKGEKRGGGRVRYRCVRKSNTMIKTIVIGEFRSQVQMRQASGENFYLVFLDILFS